MLGRSSTIFWYGVLAVFSVGIGFMLTVNTKPLRAENAAEMAICRAMAEKVLAGEASRFDYMATRCPAGFLVPAEGV